MAPRRTARPIDPSLLPPPPDAYSQQHQSNDGPPSQQQPPPPWTSSTAGYGAGQHFDPSSSQPHYGQQDPAYYQQPQQQPQQQAEYYSSPPPPPSTHIPQPPHTSGRQFKGPRSKIEAEQVPSPVVLWEQEKEIYDREGEHFVAAREMNGVVPSSATDYRAVDEGNATPSHLRLTTYNVPASRDLATTSQIPFGLVVQPFARLRPDEAPVPVARFWERGPERCKNCRAYINVHCKWSGGGERWECNLCGKQNGVFREYYSTVRKDQMTGVEVRDDILERPELLYGTVDLVVPSEYNFLNPAVSSLPDLNAQLSHHPSASSRHHPFSTSTNSTRPPSPSLYGSNSNPSANEPPRPDFGEAPSGLIAGLALAPGDPSIKRVERKPEGLKVVFLLDVSWNAGKSGLIGEWSEAVRKTLYGEQEGARGGGDEGSEGSSLVVVGGDETGAAAGSGCRLAEGTQVAFMTFDRAVHFYDFTSSREHATMQVMSDIDDVFLPVNRDQFFVDPIESRTQILRLLSSLPKTFADSPHPDAALGPAIQAALLTVARIGGQINVFQTSLPTFGAGALKPRDEPKLQHTDREKTLFVPQDIFWRNLAEECVDAGVGVNMFLFPNQYIDVATIGILSAITGGDLFYLPKFEPVRMGGRLRAALEQVLLRETVSNATMIIRCCTGLRIGDQFGSFLQRSLTDLEFGTLDSDKAIAAYLIHEGTLDERIPASFQAAILHTSASGERRVRCINLQVPVTSLIGNVFRYADIDSAVTLLTKEAISDTTQKLLPVVREGLTRRCVKLLASYRRNCALGSPPGQLILPESFKLLPLFTLALMKSKALKGGNVISDVRVTYMRYLKTVGVAATMTFLYPRMIPFHALQDDDGFPGSNGRIKVPSLMRGGYSWMEPHGAYLLINGEVAIIWLGAAISPQILDDLWGVDDLQNLDTRMATLPRLPTRLSTQLRNILQHFSLLSGRDLPVILARQNVDGSEIDFANMLTEDANNGELSYPDYLMIVHKQITVSLSARFFSLAFDASLLLSSVSQS
ncbi:hypothetical protein BDY24DRAFT_426217 [Mrakia frigida]|uniref:uncharacterized protein n=1 Tax=Mrakia frigida TaxID=29902 RepID=UPI003FCBF9FA